MKTQLCIVLAAVLLCGCKPTSEISKPIQWEYAEFNWPQDIPLMEKKVYLATYEGGKQSSNDVYTASGVMELISAQGWEFVSENGEKYMVKRRRAKTHEGIFAVWASYTQKK